MVALLIVIGALLVGYFQVRWHLACVQNSIKGILLKHQVFAYALYSVSQELYAELHQN